MSSLKDTAVILRTYRTGEADKIIVLYTKEHGKLRAIAKSSRKTTSKLGARLEPLSYVNVILWQGKSLATVTSVDVIDNFSNIRSDLDKVLMATTMVEIIEKFTPDEHSDMDFFRLLANALETVNNNFSPAILAAFCFKILILEGLSPQIDRCCSCGATSDLVAFNPEIGGILCSKCRSGHLISPKAIELMGLIFNGQISRALHIGTFDRALAREVEALGIKTIEHHLEQGLKSHLNLRT